MADVTVEVAGRQHRLGCEDGEEDRLRALAREIDAEAGALAKRMQAGDEARLMLLVALVLADRAEEGRAARDALAERVEALEGELAAVGTEAERLAGDLERLRAERSEERDAAAREATRSAATAERVSALAARIEALSARLSGS